MKPTLFLIAIINLMLPLITLAGSGSETEPAAENEIASYTPQAKMLLDQLQQQLTTTMLAVAEHESKAGKNMAGFHYVLALPAQQLTNLGLVLDLADASNGYRVLSVSPGSTAENLAIKSNDYLVEINGIDVNQASSEQVSRLLFNLVPGEQLQLGVKSNGKIKTLATELAGQYVPAINLEIGGESDAATMLVKDGDASNACGVVSIFFHPPEARDIYPATINKIDDDHLKRGRNSYKLPVGKHTIYLHEQIDDRDLSFRSRGNRSTKAKSIEIAVAANTTYYLGAQYIRSKKFSTFDNGYWEPVLWKTSALTCKFQ